MGHTADKKQETKIQANNTSRQIKNRKQKMKILVISALIASLAITSFTMPTPAPLQSCTCDVNKKAKFRDCNKKNPAEVWGNHYDDDIGLHTDCLPPVPEK